MYDSRHTDYKITHSSAVFSQHPQADVAKYVFNAFRERGLAIGVYFSKPDWSSPDYWWPYFPPFDRNVNYNPDQYPDRWQRFKELTYNQIEELMANYGKVDILWLDGGWVRPAGSLTDETRPWLGKNQWIQDVDIPRIARMARQHQPGLLIVDRTVHGEFENYRTPEQQIPNIKPDYPWESCITLGSSWYAIPGEHYKSLQWIIHTLVKISAKGGNFLLGIGPDKTGDLVPEVYQRLKETGRWMQTNGRAIYETRPLEPYVDGKFACTQSKDGAIQYLFYLLDENESIPSAIQLPKGFATENKTIQLLGFDKELKIKIKGERQMIEIPQSFRKTYVGSPAIVMSRKVVL